SRANDYDGSHRSSIVACDESQTGPRADARGFPLYDHKGARFVQLMGEPLPVTAGALYPSDSTGSRKALIFSAALRGSAPLRELLRVHAETRRRRRAAESYRGFVRQF